MANESISIDGQKLGIFQYRINYDDKSTKITIYSFEDKIIKNRKSVKIIIDNKDKIKCELIKKIKNVKAPKSPTYEFLFQQISEIKHIEKNENENPIEVLEL